MGRPTSELSIPGTAFKSEYFIISDDDIQTIARFRALLFRGGCETILRRSQIWTGQGFRPSYDDGKEVGTFLYDDPLIEQRMHKYKPLPVSASILEPRTHMGMAEESG